MKTLPLFFALSALPTMAAMTSLTASNDTYIRDGRSNIANGVAETTDFRFEFTAYFQFDLSSLNAASIQSATLTIHEVGGANLVTPRIAVYGLPDIAGNTEQNWHQTDSGWSSVPGADFGLDFRNVGQEWTVGDPGAQTAFLTNLDQETGATVTENVASGTSSQVFTLTGADLTSFLNTRINDLVTFVVEPTDTATLNLATIENADSSLFPTLSIEYTPVPEPSAALLGGLGLLGLLRRRRA